MEKYRQKQRFSSMIAAVHASCNKKETDVFQHFHLQKQRFFSRIREKLVTYDVMFLLFTQLQVLWDLQEIWDSTRTERFSWPEFPHFQLGAEKSEETIWLTTQKSTKKKTGVNNRKRRIQTNNCGRKKARSNFQP